MDITSTLQLPKSLLNRKRSFSMAADNSETESQPAVTEEEDDNVNDESEPAEDNEDQKDDEKAARDAPASRTRHKHARR